MHRYGANLRGMIGDVYTRVAALHARAFMWGYDRGFRVLRPRLHHTMGVRCPWCGDARVAVQGQCLICSGCHRVSALVGNARGQGGLNR